MSRRVSFSSWLSLAALAAVGACGKSHPVDPTDAGADALGCPPVLPETCVRGDCCDEDPREAERVPGTCDFRCPDGWTPASLCDPAPSCDLDACTDNTDCILADNTCCGPCGEPRLSDFDAIHRDRQEEHYGLVCPEPEICPDCPIALNPGLGATCDGGRCRGFDLATLPLTECARDTDCRLRVRDCCPCGSDPSFWNLIAIRADAETDYEALVCPTDFGCPECAPPEPTDARAVCTAGRCQVEVLTGP